MVIIDDLFLVNIFYQTKSKRSYMNTKPVSDYNMFYNYMYIYLQHTPWQSQENNFLFQLNTTTMEQMDTNHSRWLLRERREMII
jgi:hypothetical protein